MRIPEILTLLDKSKQQTFPLPTAEIFAVLRANGLLNTEFYQNLEMSLQYADAHEDISYQKTHVELHSHNFYELLFVRSGNVDYLLNGRRYCLQAGDLIFIAPDISHRPLFLEALVEPYARLVLWLSKDLIAKLEEITATFRLKDAAFILRTGGTHWQFLENYFLQAAQENTERQYTYAARICVLAFDLLL